MFFQYYLVNKTKEIIEFFLVLLNHLTIYIVIGEYLIEELIPYCTRIQTSPRAINLYLQLLRSTTRTVLDLIQINGIQFLTSLRK